MEYTTINGINLKSSRIGLGTWAMGGWMWGGTDENESIRTIHAAFEKGINLIDTAPVYGFGHSEEIVGKAVEQWGDRDKVIIATKVGLDWRNGAPIRNASRQRLTQEIEDSLRRLRTTYIDVYQVHWPDPLVPVEETAETMRRFYEQGKIRAIGVSNYSAAEMDHFRTVAPLHTVQPPYNLFERGIETEILPYVREHNISTLTYGALCRGLLSGRMDAKTQFKGDDLRKTDPKFHPPRYFQYLQAVDELDHYAREHCEFRQACASGGKAGVAGQWSCPRNKRMPISTLRSTFAWPAGVGMRCPQVKHSWRATRPTWTCLPSSGPESRTG